MAARQQTYQFEGESCAVPSFSSSLLILQRAADIHTLWGMLLVGFACFRFLTYFILYVATPLLSPQVELSPSSHL